MRLPGDRADSFPALIRILSSGGVAIAPGDTMYGIIGIAPETDAAIRRLKGREEDKPFLMLILDATWLPRLTDAALPSRLARHWPGPLTIVFPARSGGTVAVRVPDSPFLSRLLAALGKPLYSTSVNRSGRPPLATIDAICREFESDVGAVFDGGDVPPGEPSTLVDATVRPFQVVRKGALDIPPEDLG